MTAPASRGMAWAGARLRALLTRWLQLPALVRWSVPAAIMVLLWSASAQSPRPREPDVVLAVLHNGMHLVAFGALAAAVWLAMRAPGCDNARVAAWTAWAVAVGYGVVDELHQSWVPGRVSSLADVASDACGALLAVMALRAWLQECRPGVVAWGAAAAAGAGSVLLATFGPW